jgi:uncharacterized protein (TIGR04255 family)
MIQIPPAPARDSMPERRYARPPITEAVIEIRFASGISEGSMSRLLRSLRRGYPAAEALYDITVQFDAGSSANEPIASSKQKLSGYKASSAEGTDLIIFAAERIGTVRLAPYCGWDLFLERAQQNFETFRKIAGFRPISRIATRYINRIDIPAGGSSLINTTEYVALEPRIPDIISNIHGFTTQFVGDVPAVGGRVIVNAGTVASPLIDHVSLLLDIDLYVDQDLPQKEVEIWDLFLALRKQKNAVFEAFVTDRARELFNRG